MDSGENGLGDFHSHLVPGVDDGARTAEEALEGLARMVGKGYERIVTTPHLRASRTADAGAFGSRVREIEGAWAPVLEEAGRRWPELDLRLGFEVRLDGRLADPADDRLRLGGTRFMLVEWSWMRAAPDGARVLSALRGEGVVPVVAHPERYGGLDRELGAVAEWRDAGAYLQVNTGSLVGRYGERARTVAFRLLERGWVDYLSTDFHGRAHLSLHTGKAEARLAAVGGEDHFELLTGGNPRRLFDDEEPLPVPPLAVGTESSFLVDRWG